MLYYIIAFVKSLSWIARKSVAGRAFEGEEGGDEPSLREGRQRRTRAGPAAAGFGAKVTIRRGGAVQVLEIVGEDEADPAQGRLSWTSPLASALDGALPGETVELDGGAIIELLSVGPGDRG